MSPTIATVKVSVVVVMFVVAILGIVSSEGEQPRQKVYKLQFPTFNYRKKPQHEKALKNKKSSCEVHPKCQLSQAGKFSGIQGKA